MQVAVIDQNRRPLAPTSEVRARLLLKEGKAAVFRRAPFTTPKRVVEDVQVPDLRLKLDPGSRKTGVAIVNQASGQVITQLMENPEISGIAYQQGELAGYEVREYLLEKWGQPSILPSDSQDGWLRN
jgi:RRXRR protein